MKEPYFKSKTCPVPLEQQPIYEYEQLKDSWFFSWATLDLISYFKKLIWANFWISLIFSPLIYALFSLQKYPLLFSLSLMIVSLIITSLIIIQHYLGWRYIGDRLQESTILFEKSGWYDGQRWQKTEDMIRRDQLIIEQKINPISQRLKKTFLILIIILSLLITSLSQLI